MTVMATGALLLFEQGQYMEAGAGTVYPTQAALLVGVRLSSSLPERRLRLPCCALPCSLPTAGRSPPLRAAATTGRRCGAARPPPPGRCWPCRLPPQGAGRAALQQSPCRRLPWRDAGPPPPLAGLLNGVMVLSLGGVTGPAMNPGRDLGPRLAFHLMPIPGK